ncbi:MAG: metalloregulator ArsR/SmtB family transcription factor [Myxococcales bacterium]|nr:metalloregulator ArsR/SmtB family transcription factor [Myxococcales bacterium]
MNAEAAEADAYGALADPTRRRILTLISGQERSVSNLVEHFDMSQPAVSQHLKVLRDAGIVRVRKDGRRRLYSVEFERLRRIHDWVSQFERYWEPKLDALEQYLSKPPR